MVSFLWKMLNILDVLREKLESFRSRTIDESNCSKTTWMEKGSVHVMRR